MKKQWIFVVGMASLLAQCSTMAVTRVRNEYNVLVSTSSLNAGNYIPLAVIHYETFPNISLLGFIPPVRIQPLMRDLEEAIRDDLTEETLELGGDAIIDLKVERKTSEFNFVIKWWTLYWFELKGLVVKLKDDRVRTLLEKYLREGKGAVSSTEKVEEDRPKKKKKKKKRRKKRRKRR